MRPGDLLMLNAFIRRVYSNDPMYYIVSRHDVSDTIIAVYMGSGPHPVFGSDYDFFYVMGVVAANYPRNGMCYAFVSRIDDAA